MIARAAGQIAVFALGVALFGWALVTAWDAEAALERRPTCPPEPLHGDDVVCVCNTAAVPTTWECWAAEPAAGVPRG